MPRLKLPSLCLFVLLGATGCPTKPGANLEGFDCDPTTGICVPRDGGVSDADGQGGTGGGSGGGGGVGGGGAGGTTIQILSPSSPAYTNGSIVIQVSVVPPSAVTDVDLFDGGSKIGTVASPFSFTWNTSAVTGVVEGPHEVTARATVSGQPIISAPITIHVDRTAPQISMRSPAAGATEVLFADPMEIVFSEAIAPASVAGSITLSRSGNPIASATVLADSRTVAISLSDRRNIVLPAEITVSVNPTIADLAGNQLGATASWSWSAPVWVKLQMLAGQRPELAIGPDDRLVVLNAVEQGAIGSNDFVLQLARLAPTRRWDTTAPSPQGPRPMSWVSSTAALTIGADGLPVVAWSEAQGNMPGTVHVAKWSGSAWDSSYGQLDAVAGSGTSAGLPSLGVSPSGDLFVAWAETNPTASTVFAARWQGTSWDLVYGNVGVIGAASPALTFGLDGRPVLAYGISLNDNGVSRWTGSNWSTLPTYRNYAESPTLAVDATGRPAVISRSGQSADQYLRLYFWSQSANAWVEETFPAVPTGLEPGDAQLIIPSDGLPVIAWTEFDTTMGARVVRVTRHTGILWDFAYGSLNGFTGTNSDGATPRIVLDRGGSPIVAWQETDGTFQSTYVWRSNH